MKVTIYYFSGTGNTKWAADKIKEKMEDEGIEVNIISIDKSGSLNVEKNDIIIIGTPVYSELPPKIVTDFIDRLPEIKGIKCAVYSTQAAGSAPAADCIGRKLLKKGYEVLSQAYIKMPKNYYFLFGKKKPDEDMADILDKADAQINQFVSAVSGGKKLVQRVTHVRAGFARVFNGILMSYLMGEARKFGSSEECTKCGLCVRSCPKGNITLEKGHAVFHSKCMMCLRCIHLCPENAITFNNKKIIQTQKEIIKGLNLR